MKRYIKSAVQPLSELSWRDCRDIAKCEDTPDDVLAEIMALHSDSYAVLTEIASNPNASTDTIDKLATIGDSNIKFVLAGRQDLSTYALSELATDYYYATLCRVAANPKATPAILNKLLSNPDCDYDVYRRIAGNPNATPAILMRAVNKNCNVTVCALANPAASDEFKQKLVHHPDRYVRRCLGRDSDDGSILDNCQKIPIMR